MTDCAMGDMIESRWAPIWRRIEKAPIGRWIGLPMSKESARRVMWRIYQKTEPGLGRGVRKSLLVEQERLVDHDVIWIRRFNG